MGIKLKFPFSYLYSKWTRPGLLPQDEENLNGKIVLVTGANGGLGQATVAELAKRGAKIILACRSLEKGVKAIAEIRKKTHGGQLFLHQLDLGDLASIRTFAGEITSEYPHLNILINNAGYACTSKDLKMTKNGFEAHMGINCLGHVLLTQLLLGHLKKGENSRIIFVSSSMHLLAHLNLNDLMLQEPHYMDLLGIVPYANSKLAILLYSRQLSKILENFGINTYALCPGLNDTGIFSNCSRFTHFYTKILLFFAGISPKEGCKTIVYCTTSKKCSGESGKMYRFHKEWKQVTKRIDKQSDVCEKFFQISLDLVGIKL